MAIIIGIICRKKGYKDVNVKNVPTEKIDEEKSNDEPVVETPRYKGYRLKQAEELLAEIDELEDIEEAKVEKQPETDEEKREKLIGLIEKARTVKKNLMELLNKNKKTDEN